jgi:hypothetical protein
MKFILIVYYIKMHKSLLELIKNKHVLIGIVVVLCLFVWWSSSKKEKYENDSGLEDQYAGPKYIYDKSTGIIMAGDKLNPKEMHGRFIPPSDNVLPLGVIPEDSYLLDDGNNGKSGLQHNMCDKMCCSAQYPVPFELSNNQNLCDLNDVVPSNLMCNNAWQDSGCLCLTKKQADFLSKRGDNSD